MMSAPSTHGHRRWQQRIPAGTALLFNRASSTTVFSIPVAGGNGILVVDSANVRRIRLRQSAGDAADHKHGRAAQIKLKNVGTASVVISSFAWESGATIIDDFIAR